MDIAVKILLCYLLVSSETAAASIDRFAKLDSLINSGNLSHPPWFDTGKPITVVLDIHLSELRDVNPERLEIELGYFRHLRWTDERLRYDSKLTMMNLSYIPWEPTFKRHVWTPDVHVTNAANSWFHSPEPDTVYRLSPNGSIWESLLLSSTLICKKAPTYPKIEFDCVMRFESYGYTRKEMTLDWKAKQPQDRIDLFASPTFQIKHISLQETCEDRRNIGLYDCIEFHLMVYQEYQPFVTQIFVPSSLIVMASWLTFWIDKSIVSARISLGGLCLIASITHSVGLTLGLRHNIEWHSVNIWLHACVIFVISALVEYGVVHSLYRRINKQASPSSSKSNTPATNKKEDSKKKPETNKGYRALQDVTGNSFHGSEESQTSDKGSSLSVVSRLRRIVKKLGTNPGKIDTIMRVVYPTLFALFVICYWVHFTKSD